MRFHEIREFAVPGINFDEAVPGTDPVTGRPLGVAKPGVLDTVKDLYNRITKKPKGISPLNPLKSMQITQPFKPGHMGVDLRAAVGTPLYAPEAGVVQLLRGQRAGLYIELTTATGVHKFMHLSEFKVPNGAQVQAGNIIALTGNTGVTTGPHLHWELWVDGKPRSAL
jgi:murein DD-endopeptidase MepM/ murein hydrolase activator NlpD